MHAVNLPFSTWSPNVSEPDVLGILSNLLASAEFAKAQRMRRLLRFLVEAQLNGARKLTEHSIGIAVFDRHPASYHTGEDPIVRVQMGRLRQRLRTYYASAGRGADLMLSIPLGSYVPEIRRPGRAPEGGGPLATLALLPLTCPGDHPEARGFAHGLNEQLAYQLFHELGCRVLSHSYGSVGETASGALSCGASHCMEGSVRVEGQRTRVAVRLLETTGGCIVWSGQFDCSAARLIGLQEELSAAICGGLKQYVDQAALR